MWPLVWVAALSLPSSEATYHVCAVAQNVAQAKERARWFGAKHRREIAENEKNARAHAEALGTAPPASVRSTLSACDQLLYDASFNLGVAATAAAVRTKEARAAQSRAQKAARAAIDRAVGTCGIGTADSWAFLTKVADDAPHAAYTKAVPALLERCRALRIGICYAENRKAAPRGLKNRDLGADMIADDPKMTIDKCIDYCRGKGHRYAGLQYAKWCFCGDRVGRHGKSTACTMKCAGNANQICGGAWANSVFETGASK